MLTTPTLEKLTQLKLHGMLAAYEQCKDQSQLTFAEGLGLFVEQECAYRRDKRLKRLLRTAKLRYPQALVEDIQLEHKRALQPDQWQRLIQGHWLLNRDNLILLGPTGIGKTYCACACAQLACRQGVTTRYFRVSKLLEALRLAHADGSYPRFCAQLLKAQCLVLDDWGLDTIAPERRADLLEIIDDGYDQRSVIIASQLPIAHWHGYLGDATIADALLDRLIHRAEILELKGESLRKTSHPT